MPTASHTLETWLARHDLDRVLRGLQALAEQHGDPGLRSDAIFQSGRYHSLLAKRRKRLISQADDQQEEAQIREALLQLITDLPAEWDDAPLAELQATHRADLTLQAKTDRGREDLHYVAGDTWRLYVQVSRPCHVRVIYRLADERLALLVEDQPLDTHETNQWIDLTGEFEVSAPYGEEAFYLFAQTQPFSDLQTVWEPDGYTRVTEGLPSALRKIRGFKKKTRFAEDSLQILTYESL